MPCRIQKDYPGRNVKIVERNGETFRLISAKTVKGKYSISTKYHDIFVLEELFDKNLDIVWDECLDIVFEFRKIFNELKELGLPPKSASPRAKKQAIEVVQARYIDKIGKDKYLEIFPMVDKKSAKTTKQRSKEQVREVKSRIIDIKKLAKELELPPQPTQPEGDIVEQINNAIANDESLKALEDDRDIKKLKEEKAKIEVPDLELDIDLFSKDKDENKEVKNEVGANDVTSSNKTSEIEETQEETVEGYDFDDLESFFLDSDDGLF